ncbi:MAG: phosphatidate cytidylyltransferase, partial [Hyphomicrobiales bacterium]|nr:phosphatidate cytidylyltransferase [Hyphomicrobiales bacterium]
MTPQEQILALFGGVGALLIVATVAGRVLRHRARAEAPNPVIENLNARIDAWWGMVALIGA